MDLQTKIEFVHALANVFKYISLIGVVFIAVQVYKAYKAYKQS